MKKQNVNYALNFLKGIACIGVVFIHMVFPGMFGEIIKNIAAFAVPIFFMIAGYYAFGKNTDVIKRRLLKIIKIFIYGFLLFFLYGIAVAIKNHELNIFLSSIISLKSIIKFFVFCTIDFAVPLWYLIAMIEVYFLWYFIVKYQKEDKSLKLIPALFILQVLITSYCETKLLGWAWKINFVTRGLPWFLFGYYLHTDCSKKFINTKSYKLVIGAIIGCIITLIPDIFHLNLKFNVIGYIPYAICLFILSLKYSERKICSIIEYIGSELSLNIYVLHVPIGGVINLLLGLFFKTSTSIYLWIYPIIVLISTIFASWILNFTINMIKNLVIKQK